MEESNNDRCRFVKLPGPTADSIKGEDVLELTEIQKDFIFSKAASVVSSQKDASDSILERLKDLSRSSAVFFDSKANLIKHLVFRLTFPMHDRVANDKLSYIALSYRWTAKQLARVERAEQPNQLQAAAPNFALPIPPILSKALVAELQSESEGIWCDQICIDQQNKAEKAVSVGLMDIIYQEARCVVVALADVLLNEEQQTFLESYIPDYLSIAQPERPGWRVPHRIEEPPFLEKHPILYEIYWKIVESDYFKRAWCSHEMRMGKRLIFLVPCANADTIFRFSGAFLVDLLLITAGLPDSRRSITPQLRDAIHNAIVSSTTKQSDSVTDQRSDSGLLHVFDQVYKLGAGGDPDLPEPQRSNSAILDKMTIALNVARLGIVIAPRSYSSIANVDEPLTEHTRNLILLSLAENNPLALCTSGKPLNCSTSARSHSWIREYVRSDLPMLGSGHQRRLMDSPAITLSPDDSDLYIELGLCEFRKITGVNGPTDQVSCRAVWYIDSVMKIELTHPGERVYNWRSWIRTNEETRRIFVHTVACILQNGPLWVSENLSLSNGDFLYGDMLRTDLQPYIDCGLPGFEIPLSLDEESTERTIRDWVNTNTKGLELAQRILQFTTAMLYKAFHAPWEADILRPYRPFIISTGSKRFLMFLSRERPGPDAIVVVPKALVSDEFYGLRRVWILDDQTVGTNGKRELHLLHRERIFGPSICDEVVEWQEMQKVYGPMIVDGN